MLFKERLDLISRVLTEKSTIKISEVMELCNVSHETARRDLETLQEQGIARRIHGGAVLNPQSDTVAAAPREYPNHFYFGNMAVAKAAAQLVHAGDSILLDAGRTVSHLAHYVRNVPDLFVVTPNLLVINELSSSNVHLHGLAGELSHEDYCYTGKLTQTTFKSFNVNTAFISCAGLDLKRGILTDYDNIGLSRTLIREHSTNMVLLLNSAKLHVRGFSNLCSLSLIDTVIVDDQISSAEADMLRSFGPKVIVAPTMHEDLENFQHD